jgi:hypothetical protein
MTGSIARRASFLALGLAVLWPGPASAQEATRLSFKTDRAIARAVAQEAATAPGARTTAAVSDDGTGRPSPVMQSLYVTTAVVQILDAHSTLRAVDAGADELNSIVAPLAHHPAAFVALKSGMAAAFIYGGHTMSKHHKVGAIITLGVLNSFYLAIAVHNYHVANTMNAANAGARSAAFSLPR